MNFNIFNSLILAGVIQGFIFGAVWLFTKKYRSRNTYFLIALIVTYSLNNLQYYLLDTEMVSFSSFYSYLYLCYGLLMPPLFLLYGLSIMNPTLKIDVRKKLLFLPFLLSMLLAGVYKFKVVVLGNTLDENSNLWSSVRWSEFLAIAFSLVVVFFLLRKVSQFQKTQQFSKNKIQPQLQWFKVFLFFQLFAIFVWGASEIAFADEENFYFYPVWIIVAIITYWLGHIGMYKYGINEQRKKIRKTAQDRYSISEVLTQKNDHITALKQFLEGDRNFLNPNMSLDMIADELNLSQGHLSKLINTELGLSFKDYLNSLRIEEAKRYLKDSEFSNYTLAAIGLEAGFNSKSAFNASFKKITGLTPSQFKQQQG